MLQRDLIEIGNPLSATTLGQEWLAQFSPDDQPAATLLLDSLVLVSTSHFEQQLLNKVRTVASPSLPAALYVVRDPPLSAANEILTYFPNDKRRKPDILQPGSIPGSEARLGHIATALARNKANNYLNHPSLSLLKSRRCHNIILIDDIIGSGKRTSDFLTSFRLSKTIRSWTSSGIVKINVVSFAAIQLGLRRIRKTWRHPPDIHYCMKPTFATSAWSKKDHDRVVALCRKYAPRVAFKYRHHPLGFNDSMGMVVFEYSCPNNVPPILWSASNNWKGIFPEREIPLELTSHFSQEKSLEELKIQLKLAGQKAIAASNVLHGSGLRGRQILALLALRRQRIDIDRIGSILRIEHGELYRLARACEDSGLLTANWHLTDQGLVELQYAKSRQSNDRARLSDNKFYFPKKLREARA